MIIHIRLNQFITCCLLAGWLLLFSEAKAQSDFDLTQRWFNESVYNPAATGNSFTTGIFLHGRAQWAGLDGAPTTQAATFDTYVGEINSAFGLAFLGDQIGYKSSYTGKLSYAYYIRTGELSTLALGLSAGLLNRNANITDDMADDPADPTLGYGRYSYFDPDFDVGLEYKGPLKLGVALRHIGLGKEHPGFPKPSVNIWAYASSRFNVSRSVSLEPVFSYMNRNEINRYEVGAIVYFLKMAPKFKYNDRFWLGGMYRLNGQFALLAGIHLTPRMRLGYSFDYGTGDLATVSNVGTHEIFLAWQLNRIFYRETLCPAYKSVIPASRR